MKIAVVQKASGLRNIFAFSIYLPTAREPLKAAYITKAFGSLHGIAPCSWHFSITN